MKLPLIDDPHGPFAMDVGTKASPSRMKYAGGSCVVITDDDIGEGQPGTRRRRVRGLFVGSFDRAGLDRPTQRINDRGAQPMMVAARTVQIGASIGVARTDPDDPRDAALLREVDRCDHACCAACLEYTERRNHSIPATRWSRTWLAAPRERQALTAAGGIA
jgi:hypothetical protein